MSDVYKMSAGDTVDLTSLVSLRGMTTIRNIPEDAIIGGPLVPPGNPEIEINGKSFPIVDGDAWIAVGHNRISIARETAEAIREWVDSGHRIIHHSSRPICPECGRQGLDHWEYCPHDGTKMEWSEAESYEVDREWNRVANDG